MSDETEPTLVLAAGRYLRLLRRGRWEFVERVNVTGIVALLAITDDQRVLLLRQYREPIRRWVIELPAGLVGDGVGQSHEALVDAARRELLEETGYAAEQFEPLTVGPPSAGLSTELITFFRATRLKRVHAGGGVDGEQIEVFEAPIDRIDAWLAERERGEMVDPKVYTAMYFLRCGGRNPCAREFTDRA
ncbi:MAG: NUDIX hydrolase [Phycisphaerae bacterium]